MPVTIRSKKIRKSHRRRTTRRTRRTKRVHYKLTNDEINSILDEIDREIVGPKVLRKEIDGNDATDLIEVKFRSLLENFVTKRTKFKGNFGTYHLSREGGVYKFCLDQLQGYFKYGEPGLKFLIKYQKKGSPMKGGGVLFYDFDLSAGERISDMPPVVRRYDR